MSYDLGLTDPDDDLPAAAPDALPASAPADMPGHIASISDNSYRGYNGPLVNRAVRWWVIAVTTIRSNVNKSRFGFWIPAGLLVLSYLIVAVIFYFNASTRDFAAARGMAMPDGPANPYAASLYVAETNIFASLFIFIAVLIVGSASIASDNRANALLVYLSKPITRVDYLVGKWVGLFLLIFGLVLVPSLLLFGFYAAVYASDGFFHGNAALILRVVIAAAVPAVLQTSLIIGFSSWSKSSRIAGASYAAFYLVLGILLPRLASNLRHSERTGSKIGAIALQYSSVGGTANAICQRIYGVDPEKVAELVFNGGRRHRKSKKKNDEAEDAQSDTPADESSDDPTSSPLGVVIALGAAYVLIPLSAAYYKVRAVEVIRG